MRRVFAPHRAYGSWGEKHKLEGTAEETKPRVLVPPWVSALRT